MRAMWLLAGALLAVPSGASADCAPDCASRLCTRDLSERWGAARAEAISEQQATIVEVVGPLAATLSAGDTIELSYEWFVASGPVLLASC